MLDALRSQAQTQGSGAKTISAEKYNKVRAFASYGGGTDREDAHVKELAARLSASARIRPDVGEQQRARSPAAPASGTSRSTFASPPPPPVDKNEPWKTDALRSAMRKVCPTVLCMWGYEDHLCGLANAACGWIGKKEFRATLRSEPLATEMFAAWSGRAAQSPRTQPSPAPPPKAAERPQSAPQPKSTGNAHPCPLDLSTPPTEEERSAALAFVRGVQWPPFASVYDAADLGGFTQWDAKTLQQKSRTFCIALRLAAGDGRFALLAGHLEKGQVGMEAKATADYYRDGNYEEYYHKTLGDVLQSYWCRRHLANMVDCFQLNVQQAAIARWLAIAQCTLPVATGQNVAAWADHPLADFQEMLTMYLPSSLMNEYMNICTNYFLLYFKEKVATKLCQFRDRRGLLRCDKQACGKYGDFCAHTHASQSRTKAAADFDGRDYGEEYLVLLSGDAIAQMDPPEEACGWAYGLNLRSLRAGWFPPTYVVEQ